MAGDRTTALAQQQAQQRAAEQRAAQQRVHQAQLAQQAQQRQAQQRQAQQRQAQQRQAQQRQAQQRQAQQRQAQQRLQHRQQEAQRRAAEAQRREAQRLRVWQRTAAKRAARQVETELAIEERETRMRTHPASTEELLAGAVVAPLKFGRLALRRQYMQAAVDVGDLGRPLVPPRREEFGRGGWRIWSRGDRERRGAEAESAYQAALAAYEEAEFDRVRQLSTLKRDHQRRQAEAAEELWVAYQAGDAEAVATYALAALTSRPWPDGFGSTWHVGYEAGERHLTVEYELPAKARSGDVVAEVALRVLVDLFDVLDEALVEVISFNGLAVAGPSLVSVTVTRERWAAVRLFDGDPQSVLRAV